MFDFYAQQSYLSEDDDVVYSQLLNKRTGTLKFYDVLRRIYVTLTLLALILSKFTAVWWLNQASTTYNKEAMRHRKLVRFNYTGMFIRVTRVFEKYIEF